MKFLFALPFIILSVVPSCNDDDVVPALPECGPAIEIFGSVDGFDSGDSFAFSDLTVDGTCLSIEVSATGCDADGWTADLVTDGSVAESTPTQTSARFILDRQLPQGASVCQAIVSKTFTFDLAAYLTPGALPSNLSVLGPDTTRLVVLIE